MHTCTHRGQHWHRQMHTKSTNAILRQCSCIYLSVVKNTNVFNTHFYMISNNLRWSILNLLCHICMLMIVAFTWKMIYSKPFIQYMYAYDSCFHLKDDLFWTIYPGYVCSWQLFSFQEIIYSKPFILYIYMYASILIRLCSVYMLHGSCFHFERWSAQIIQYMYAYDSCFQEMIYSEPFIQYSWRSFHF